MNQTGIVGLVLVIITTILSIKGFNNRQFFNKYKFQVDSILRQKKFMGLISSGFLHVDWQHLIFNMISLLIFSSGIELIMGPVNLLIIYFVSLLGGNLLALFIHKHHYDYSAVGASGAISGLIFSSIVIFPFGDIGIFLLPIGIPAWLFGLIYVIISIFGIKSANDNIGHDAHLGGGIIGMLLTCLIYPAAFWENSITTLLIAIPAIGFLVLIVKKPSYLLVGSVGKNTIDKYYSIDHKYNRQKKEKQSRIDKILDKINCSGINSLSKEEKEFLENSNNY